MAMPHSKPPFTLAEIMIAAPWATSLLRSPQDHDKGILLHSNITDDERSVTPDRIAALEREARQARAEALVRAFGAIARAAGSLFRKRRARMT